MNIVIGARPAGLSAATFLEGEKIVIEKEAECGGLCRSFAIEGAVFDYGGHAFFTKHPEIRRMVEESSGMPLYQQKRNAQIYWNGLWIPYPFQANLYNLPKHVVSDCLVGLFNTSVSDTGANSLDQWLNRFGSGLRTHFLDPYNEKVWAHPLNIIFPPWAEDRIVKPNIEEIIHGALENKDYTNFPNSQVSYPSEGGYENLFKGLIRNVKPYMVNASVKEIDLSKKLVRISNSETIKYDQLISTMPLTDLVKMTKGVPTSVKAAADKLLWNSLYLVNFVVKTKNLTSIN